MPITKSLTATMSSRQFRFSTQFTDFRSFNRRSGVRRHFQNKCLSGRESQYRTYSGFCNNFKRPKQGAAETKFIVLSPVPVEQQQKGGFILRFLRRLLFANIRRRDRSRSRKRFQEYFARNSLINARVISNIVCNEDAPKPNNRGMSELVTFFGQFIDHDVTETHTEKSRPFQIPVPKDDPVFKEAQFIPFFRTLKKGRGDRRAPVNALSSYIDASSVYGVGETEVVKLRTMKDGLLKLPGNLLPRKSGTTASFEAGDRRANENPNLTALHLLWAREHNYIAREVSAAYPAKNDEEVFQLARHIVAAELQAVVYYSFIPALTGRLLPRYLGYRRNVRAKISNRFSTVAFRVGHTMLNRTVNAVDATGVATKIMLRDAFFRPDTFVKHGVDNLLRGMMSGHAAEVDAGITGEVRNFLIPSSRSREQLDLAALNIQRGRDHEVPFCNDLRSSLGLRRFKSIEELAAGNHNLLTKLKLVYKGDVEVMDPWVCGVAESHVPGSSLGALFDRIVRDEFARLRDGDRFYFEKHGYFKPDQVRKLASVQKLFRKSPAQLGNIFSDIIARNTDIPNHQINKNPFFV